MNHIYRLCWNRELRQWVAASELAHCRRGVGSSGRGAGRRALRLSLLSAALGFGTLAHAGTSPSGGQVVAGSGQIMQSGNTTTIRQDSNLLSLNWQSFDVGADQTVNFLQPGASAIAVNRILGNTASEIYGHLNANGQVWLVNPNGVLFGKGSQVNVGGLVASTLDLDDRTLGSGSVRFAGTGKGKVTNLGSIAAAEGGYVVLLGNQVSNQGVIRAQLGMVALGGGSAVTLTFNDRHLMHLEVDKNTLQSLVENRQLIVADGGTVLMTAGARDSLVASVVNNTGTVEARGVQNHNGTITLLGGMAAGTVQVGGTLDASAPDGGDGGQIETSAAHFQLASDAKITAAAPRGKAGTWLVDPVDLTIDAAAASTISTTLQGGTSVTETTTASGATGTGTQTTGNGDINVNAAISWTNAAATLELDAYRNINVNAAVTGSGGLVLNAAGGTLTIGNAGGLSAGTGATLQAGAFVNNATASALGSKWTLYSTNPTLNTLGGLTADFIQYDATPGSTLAASGNGLVYSVAPTLKVTGLTGTIGKVYDGNTAASFSGANFTTTGLLGSDAIVSATGGSYASANAASGISVTSPGAIGNFVIADGGVPVYGYTLSGSPVTAKLGQITPKQLSAQIVGNPTKIYDGTTTATLTSSNYAIDGFIGSDSATVRQPSSIAYAGSDAGSEALNATFSVTNFTAGSGTRLANYILPTTATGMGTINQAPLLISGLLADSKTYDGSTAAQIEVGGAKLFGVIQPDVGSVSLVTGGIAGSFASANAGNGIAVAVTGYALSGSKAGNYVLQSPAGLSANITPKTLTIGQVTANDKSYDATTAASLATGSAVLNGVVGSDNVTLNVAGATGVFGQSNVGANLAVTTSGFALGGAMAGNYALSQPILSADITPALLTISMTGTPEKTYDGTDAVSLGAANFSIGGFIGSQHAVVSQSSAHYATANAGSGIDVTAVLQPSDFTPDAGTSMSNYTFASTVTGSALGTIDPLQLIGLVVGNPSKVYDGTDAAAVSSSNLKLLGLLPGQSITASFGGTETGVYDSANAGARGVTVGALPGSDFTAGGGTLLSNYILPAVWTGSGSITPAPLTGSFVLSAGIVNASKVYDGTTDIVLNGANFTLSGFVNGDSAVVNDGIHATFGQKDVGTDLPLSAQLTIGDLTGTNGTTQQELNNYQINTPVFGLGEITPRQLLVAVIGNPTKVYNGTAQAALSSTNFSISGWATGEGGTINPSATALYDSADASAANGRTVTATLSPGNYIFDSGTKLTNYDLAYTATGTGTINQAPLFVTGVSATDKVYDNGTADTLNLSRTGLAGLVSGDAGSVSLDLSGVSAAFSQKNVGSHLAVTASGFAITGGQAANYLLQPVTGLFADITQKTLTLSGVTANDKTYDGNRTAGLTVAGGAALSGVLGTDAVGFDASGASGLFSTANAGNSLKVAASGFALTGTDAGNYTLAQPSGLTADIDPKQLTAVIIGSPTKIYDGTDSATLTAADYDLQGFIAGQGGSVPQSATANYVTKNVGTGLGVVSTLVTSDFVADAGTDLSNYILPTTGAGSNGVIEAKVIDLTASRVYDGTAIADSSLFGTLQGVNGETLGLTGSGTLSSKNVGDEWSFSSLGSLALADGGNGGLASNYTLVGGTDWVTITPRQITASFDASDKTYDGTTDDVLSNAALETANGSRGLVAGDDVTLNDTTAGHFANKNAGAGKTVTGDMSIGGGDAGNYVFTNGTATATIDALHITVSATGKDKQYDATTADPGAKVQSAGVIAGDTVNFGFGSATFADKNVGTGKTVTVTGVTKSGADAGNYVVDNTTLTTTASITPRVLGLNGTRVYDGTTTADASTFNGGVVNGVAGETLALSGSFTLPAKTATNYSWHDGTGMSLGDGGNGGLASNYTLVGGVDSYTVTPRQLTASFDANDKTYDGTTSAVLVNAALEAANGTRGLIAGDNVTLTNPTVGTFDTKNVGTGKTVTGSMGITGGDAGNYVFTNGTALADIGKLALTVGAVGADKVYDGTTSDAGLTYTSNAVAGDHLTISSTSVAFTDKNVGTDKTVNVGGIAIGGADAGNYDLQNTTATATADITPYTINLTGSRVYDGTTDVSALLFGNGVVTGVAGETLTLSGTSHTADKNVGNNKSFTGAADMTLGDRNGALASNYQIGTSKVTITKLAITGAITADDKVYDATTGATTHGLLSGVLEGDTVVFNNSGVFGDKNVADGKTVTLTSSLGGADAGNYSYTANSTTTADITPLAITVVGTVADKVYDTTTDALLTGLTSNGILGSDVVDFTAASADFSDANAANGKDVTIAGIAKSGADAGNYTINTTAHTTADITPVVLDLSGTRVYDGTTAAAAGLFGSNGVLAGIAGQTVTLTGSGLVGDKNVGGNKPFASLGTLALTDGGNGGLAQNYTLVGGTDTLSITPRTITLGVTADDKIYDTTDLANATVSGLGVVGGDDIQFAPGAAHFASPNAGNGLAVSVTGITASGADAGNYSFATTAGTTADITPVVLDLSGTRVYDGTTGAAAGLFGSNGVLAGIAGQTVTLTGSGLVGDKNVGGNKPFASLGTLALTDGGNGGLAQNYTLVGGTDTLSITPKAIVVDATGSDKTYDGSTAAHVTLGSTGVVGGDQVSFTPGSALYASPNAGHGIAIDVTGIAAAGTDAGNYSFANTAVTSGNITPVVLNLAGTRVYDGTTAAVAGLFGDHGVLTGVNGETLTLSGSGTVSDKNVGAQKAFAAGGLNGFTLTGNGAALAGNYTLAGGTDWLTITPATLTVVGTQATDRVYDGTRIDALTGATLSGVFGNDDVVLGNASTGLFASKNVGEDKAVTTAMTVSGGDVGNYILIQPTGLVADVTPRALIVTATGTDKMFDGNDRDTVSLDVDGVLAGDQVAVSYQGAHFADPNVGDGKTVTVTGIAADGEDAGNYVVAPTVTTTADITGAQPGAFGVDTGTLTQAQWTLGPAPLATPYGLAGQDTVGPFSGNKKKLHRPVEPNRSRADFNSGLALKVVDGGVQMPVRALP